MRTYLLRAVARFARQLALTSPLPFPVLPGAQPGFPPPGMLSGVLPGALPPLDPQRG
ncbi:hypothetical protein ACFVVL_07510 [Kitasatospora sp. NPDC058115]|uniref:hypothetical protein n=1 Tax=Kitasatospora sp. NPDC058115 TaxID=3346347 RepID=UPI0036DB1A64